jgi:hypothetical protein
LYLKEEEKVKKYGNIFLVLLFWGGFLSTALPAQAAYVQSASIDKDTLDLDNYADYICLRFNLNASVFVRIDLHTLEEDRGIIEGRCPANYDDWTNIESHRYASSVPATNSSASITLSTSAVPLGPWTVERAFPITVTGGSTSPSPSPSPSTPPPTSTVDYLDFANIDKTTLVRNNPNDKIVLELQLLQTAFVRIDLHTINTDYVAAHMNYSGGTPFYENINCYNNWSATLANNAFESIAVATSDTGADGSYRVEKIFPITTSFVPVMPPDPVPNPVPDPDPVDPEVPNDKPAIPNYPDTPDDESDIGGGGGCNAGLFWLPLGLMSGVFYARRWKK